MKAKSGCHQRWESLQSGFRAITLTGSCAIGNATARWAIAAIFVTTCPVSAQIVPDNTLPVNSSVAPLCTTCTIDGGTVRGSNLFHSFREFSVPTGGEAFFNNATQIQNILTRVTGNSVSNIDGLIRANGKANLFFLNPNGIIFGGNARLDIGGSFFASSASSLVFADGVNFSARSTTSTTPLLTISVPIGLQYGGNPGSVQLQGSSLQVAPGKTLALVGGNVSMNGGQLLAPGGRVELGGVAGEGSVGLSTNGSTLPLSFPDGIQRADVSLNNGANVNVLAGGGGSIAINARSLDMTGESTQLQAGIASGSGSIDSKAGDIDINAIEAINLNGSRISNTVQSTAVGNSGDVTITTGSLSLKNGSELTTATSGRGNAGNINIIARNTVSIDGASSPNRTSQIASSVRRGVGNGGNINITTGSFSATNGGQVVATNFGGQGNAGSINIVARDIVIFDKGRGDIPTGAFSNVQQQGVGNGANINITTGSLYLKNGGVLNVRLLGQGNSGNVNIFARDTVSFDGISANGRTVTGAVSEVYTGSVGKGGNINITTGSLRVSNGALLSAATSGQGDAGNVNIIARDTVFLEGAGNNGIPSGAYSTVESTGVGKGGDINITTGMLSLKDGAFLSVRTRGQGNGGNITLTANTLEAINGGQVITTSNGTGKAGNITFNVTDNITLSGSNANYFARLDQFIARFGQNVVLSVDPASGMFANTSEASTGRGGELAINTRQFNIRDGAQVTVSSQGSGIAGSLIVKADAIRLDNKGKISADTTGGGGNINLLSRDLLLLRRGSSITTNATEKVTGGNITINTNNLVAVPKENSDISANATESFGGRVIVNADGIFGTQFREQPTLLSDITASSALGSQFNGTVTLNTLDIDPSQSLTELPTNLVDTSGLIANSCIGRSNQTSGKFIITGNGGLPVMPDDPLVTSYQTYQLPTVHSASVSTRLENAQDSEDTTSSKPNNSSTSAPIVEANGWIKGPNGEVILTANAPTVAPNNSRSQIPTCLGS